MKTRNIISALAALIFMVPVQSCLKDQRDYFDESSSSRLQNFNGEVQKILCDGEGAWIMDYYPGTGQMYGGYAFALKFTESEVTVYSEITDESATSLYKMTSDNGPVLVFDTYNPVLHYFATPSSSKYEAWGGDFGFTILEYDNDQMTLLGKRSGNKYYLHRAAEGTDLQEYCEGVVSLTENFTAASLEGQIGDLDVEGVVDLDSRRLYISWKTGELDEAGEPISESVNMPFVFTPEGLHLYDPMQVNGYTIRDLFYLDNYNALTNGVITLYGKLPEGYQTYDSIKGDYVLRYGSTDVNVSLVPTDDGLGFNMTGLIKDYPVYVGYDKSRGGLRILFQNITTVGSTAVKLCPLDSGAGYLTWSEGVGVNATYSESKGCFTFSDNGVWEDYVVDSFIIWSFDAAGNSAGEYTGLGTSRFFELKSLTRR